MKMIVGVPVIHLRSTGKIYAIDTPESREIAKHRTDIEWVSKKQWRELEARCYEEKP